MSDETAAAPSETTGVSEDVGLPLPDGINPAYKPKARPQQPQAAAAEEESEEPEQSEEEKKEEAAVKAAFKKLKVRGREIDVDESKYHEYAQKGAAAQETWQEAAQMKREAENFINRLKSNPKEILTDPNLGIDFKKLAADYLWEQIQEEEMSPEEKDRRREKAELEEYRQMKAAQQRQQVEERRKQVEAHYSQDYDKSITKALSTAGLPKNNGTVKRMTEYMLVDIKKGVYHDPSHYVDVVRQDYMDDIRDLFSETDGDTLLKFLGEDKAKKIRQSDLKRLKTTTPAEGHTFVPGKGMVSQKTNRKMSGLDWQRSLMKERFGK